MNILEMRSYFLLILFLFSVSVFAQGPHMEVEAQQGDGIYTLLRRNGLQPSSQLINTFWELNKERIGKDSSLYVGITYKLPIPLPEQSTELTSKLPEETAKGISITATSIPSPSTEKETPSVKKTPSVEEAASSKEVKPVKDEVKAAPVVLDVPLFGKNYARVEVKDQQLKGAVYYLIAGHGGPDPGAVGKYGAYSLGEDEYAYDVTIRLARRLMEHGATVYMIIQDEDDGIRDGNVLELDTDEKCYPGNTIPYSQKQRLRQRTEAVNGLYAKHKGSYQRMLSIHVDSRSKSENIDVFFYHHENSPSGKKLAESIQNTIISKYARHQPNRDYLGNVSPRSSLYVVKYSHPPAVFIELGNIRNDRDQRRFVLPDNRQALANWMCEGILADYNSRQ